MHENIYSKYSKIEKSFKEGKISFNDYSTSIIEWNNDFSKIIKAQIDNGNDLSHGGKLHKKIITDKTGKKVTKWVSGDQLTDKDKAANKNENFKKEFSQTNAEKKYKIEDWEKGASKASIVSLNNASQYAGSSEVRRIAKNEILKRELVPQAFIDFSLMPDFMLDAFVDKYNHIEITKKENNSLASYRDLDFNKINNSLRKDEKLDKVQANKVNDISNAINKSTLSNDIVLWRGLSGKNALLLINHIKSLKPGETYEDKSFTSTSMLQGQAIKFKELYKDTNNLIIKIMAPKGSKALSMQNLGGEDEKIMYKDEYEFLLQQNSKFQIIEHNNGEIVVKLI